MSTPLRSVGLLEVLSSTSAGPSVARPVSTLVCAASLQNSVRNAGQGEGREAAETLGRQPKKRSPPKELEREAAACVPLGTL
jgi:hypothetical protein